MKGLTTPENDALSYMLGDPPGCGGECSGSPPQPAQFSYETYIALKARGLLADFTCAAGCVHVQITPLGRTAKNIADIIAKGGPACPT